MKKLIIIFWIICMMFSGVGCKDFLFEEHEVRPTTGFLFTNPEGLSRTVTALYSYARRIVFEGESATWVGMDLGTDIIAYRGGTASALGTYSSSLNPNQGEVKFYWDHFYYIIGRANEIIYYAEKNMDVDDPVVKQAVAEAKVFRAESYFYLIRKFDKVWLNTIPTTPENYDDPRDFTPDGTRVFDLIKQDLDDAIEALDLTVVQTGRYTKGAARHIRAKVAMWLSDWDEAIKQVEAIKESGIYGLMPEPKDVFAAAKLNHKESIFAFQFERGPGGGSTGGAGHRMSLIFTPAYGSESGMKWSFDYGCYGWGRVYPNSYLLSKFDKVNDKRYTQYFQHEYRYNDPDNLPAGKNLGDVVTFVAATYMTRGGVPHCTKFTDYGYTTLEPNATTSFKDVIVYRLAETWLMGAEAYFHKYGGADANAKWYFSEIRKRAGLGEFTGTLTLDLILDEQGKELLFEGDRWFMLKRLGLLIERVQLYGGDDRSFLVQQDFLDARNQIRPHHVRWPIPQSARDQMGDAFPQNDGYN